VLGFIHIAWTSISYKSFVQVVWIHHKEAAFALAFGLSKESYGNVLTSEEDIFRIKSLKKFCVLYKDTPARRIYMGKFI